MFPAFSFITPSFAVIEAEASRMPRMMCSIRSMPSLPPAASSLACSATAHTLSAVFRSSELVALISFAVALVCAVLLWAFMTRTDTGRAIRAVAREQDGARLVGIRPERVFALAYGIGVACLGVAACLLLPTFYVSPQVGNVFVLVSFTIVVLGGMGSFPGAVVGGLIIGITESLGGLFLGESLGPIGISVVFIAVLLLRPAGLFGAAR